MLKAAEIRNKFLEFFESKGHTIVPSAPIVVKNDPTLMFTNAGMNQFKDYFLGTSTPRQTRMADTQKCLRVSGKHNDLEEVGVDTYHHTMFEMLGNWSFGDYFKAESIAWAWEFLTEVLKIDKDRIYVTVFEGDESEGLAFDQEAWTEWEKHIAGNRILKGNKKDNFWEMGDTGPCGPCSEIHVDMRSNSERAQIDGSTLVNHDHPQVIEVWNMVFIQFNRKANQSLETLPQQHVDTGMGFERLVRAIQGVTSNYDTDIFQPLISATAELSGYTYGKDEKTDIAFRVIADHIRAVSFCIADGQLPSNTGAGYVVRRILRRAIRYGYSFLQLRQPFMSSLVDTLARETAAIFPELQQQKVLVQKVIHEEELTFLRTLENGLKRLQQVTAEMQEKKQSVIPGEIAFELYDTYGFPHDLTALVAREEGLTVDEKGYLAALEEQKSRSRKAGTSETGDWNIWQEGKSVTFVGYDTTEAEARVLRTREVKQKNKTLFQLVLDRTPFYAESGGQIGDTGVIAINGTEIKVLDTKKENDLIVHFTDKLPDASTGLATAKVHTERRMDISRNHSATHLLHAALRKVLGEHIQQKGSYVGPDRLRFDFSHFSKMTEAEIEEVQTIVNEKIRENIDLDEQRNVPIAVAEKMGAMMLFGEKYGESVRVITFDEHFSRELCGGIHVPATGSIGYFHIVSEGAVAAGVRRIEAITGKASEAFLEEQIATVKAIVGITGNKDAVKSVQQLAEENASLKKELEQFQLQGLQSLKERLLREQETINGLPVIRQKVEVANADMLKKLAYDIRQDTTSIIAILGTEVDGKALIAVIISDDLVAGNNLHAGKMVKELGRHIQGGGGGQPHFATAGGANPQGLKAALEAAEGMLS
jgi:alanyl-tRNA synthetase